MYCIVEYTMKQQPTTTNIIYINKILRRQREKLAIFDVDWTLIKPKEGRGFPKDKDDWQWLRPSVPQVVRKYHRNGYRVVFLTDQTKEWKVEMIKEIIKELDIPVIAVIAMMKEYHKPNPQLFLSHFEGKFQPRDSFFVGDAAGREGDWADKDKGVADKLGVTFYTPEELFPLAKKRVHMEEKDVVSPEKEVVIMIGYPASGKSTIVKTIFEKKGYIRIDGDTLKTPERMIREAKKHITNHSIVFDATNASKEKRAHFIEFAKEHHVPVKCIWVTTPIEQSMEQNRQRFSEGGPKIPDVAFYVYRKNFEEPNATECTVIKL